MLVFGTAKASFLPVGETKNTGRTGLVMRALDGGSSCSPWRAVMKNILFVDDHEVLARLSCEILEMQGYRAVSAYDGEDALRKFRHGGFDMVVTDFRM